MSLAFIKIYNWRFYLILLKTIQILCKYQKKL
jgi:hypothetical protein